MVKLTANQEKFVQELIKGKSQREAYRIAYPKSINWTDNAIDSRASRLFNGDKVLTRYNEINDRLVKEAEDECIVEAKDVLKELGRIAFADVTDYANIVTVPRMKSVYNEETGKYENEEDPDNVIQIVVLKDTVDINKNQSAPIKSIKQGRYGVEIELYPKDKSLELLGRHLGMFKDKVELSGAVNNPMEGLTTEELKKLIYDE